MIGVDIVIAVVSLLHEVRMHGKFEKGHNETEAKLTG
jgi:hypothetical protein